jgi:hypothetical protein
VRRKSLVYSIFLGAALWLFGLAAWLTPHLDSDVVGVGLLRFVVLCLGVGCSIGAWATAVTIASIHKQTWPLYVTVAVVLTAFLTFLTIC